MRNADSQILKKDQFENYQEIDPANARMRALFDETINQDMWQLLWLPPSLEYMEPSGVYANRKNLTKRLVFSKWSAVPDAIAAISSYEAERQMVASKIANKMRNWKRSVKHSTLAEQTSQLLRITKDRNGKLTGMSTIGLLFPSTILAKEIAPMKIAIGEGEGKPVSKSRMFKVAESRCLELMQCLPSGEVGNIADTRWYWAAPAMLEIANKSGVLNWLKRLKAGLIKEETKDTLPI